MGEHVNKKLSLDKAGIIRSDTETTAEVGITNEMPHTIANI